MFYLKKEVGKFGHVLAEKRVNFMINEFKYGQTWKIGHLQLVYHFTIPLQAFFSLRFHKAEGLFLPQGWGKNLQKIYEDYFHILQ